MFFSFGVRRKHVPRNEVIIKSNIYLGIVFIWFVYIEYFHGVQFYVVLSIFVPSLSHNNSYWELWSCLEKYFCIVLLSLNKQASNELCAWNFCRVFRPYLWFSCKLCSCCLKLAASLCQNYQEKHRLCYWWTHRLKLNEWACVCNKQDVNLWNLVA